MKSWRTTIAGIGMVASGLLGLGTMLLGGQMPTPEQWTTFGGLVVAGFGLVNAADSKNLPPKDPTQ